MKKKAPIITAVVESLDQSLAIYKNHPCFVREKLSESDFLRIRRIAALYAWDIYHLFHYSRQIPNGGTYLEIGSLKGGSLLCAYLANRVAAKIVNFIAIDPALKSNGVWKKPGGIVPNFFEAFKANTKEIPNLQVIPIASDNAHVKIQNNSIDLIFLDGDHHYKQVKRDIENYWPKLKMGGIFLGHDYSELYSWWGVMDAANEIFRNILIKLRGNCSMYLVKKTKELKR